MKVARKETIIDNKKYYKQNHIVYSIGGNVCPECTNPLNVKIFRGLFGYIRSHCPKCYFLYVQLAP